MAAKRSWWDGRLLLLWVTVHVAAYLVVVVGGVAVEELIARTATAMYEVGVVLLGALAITVGVSTAFPVLSFLVHGVWMLWVTDPAAASARPPSR